MFENIDLNDFSISFLFKRLECGININLKSITLDDKKNDLILKRKNEIKKEITEKEKEDIEENNNNENKNNNNNQEININEIVSEFRKDYNISEDEYPNDILINKLKKNNYDKIKTFISLFD